MRNLRVAVAVGAVTALLAAPVSAAPPGDWVSGVGIRLSENRVHYTVSVKEAGSDVTGSFLFRGLDFRLTFGGPATCLDVDGNQAVVGGWITHAAGEDLVGLAYLVFFEDNGLTGDMVSQTYIMPADEGFIDGGIPSDFPASCPDATAGRSDEPFEVQGNFVVLDR